MRTHKSKIIEVHISTIKNGDTILHTDNKITTVCNNNIKRGFCGITLFGDSYNMGKISVKKIIELPTEEQIREGAEKWVFNINGMKWSNNDNTAGDNLGSFIAGVKWVLNSLSND